jgi:hypothetical protein
MDKVGRKIFKEKNIQSETYNDTCECNLGDKSFRKRLIF